MTSAWNKVAPTAILSFASFLLGTMLLFLMIWKAETLAGLGFTGRLYYIILLPLGLSVAGFLFGVLQLYTTYSGKQFGGTLTLSGPVVVFVLVVVLGFVLVPSRPTFAFTVSVHDPHRPQDIVLRNSGEIFVDLPNGRRHVPVNDQGQAYFPDIPINLLGQSLPIGIESDRFEPIQPDKKLKLIEGSIYLDVRRKEGRIYGRVDSKRLSCLSNAKVRVAGQVAAIDPSSGESQMGLAVGAVAGISVLVRTAGQLIDAAVNKPVGVYRTSLLAHEQFGLGVHLGSGLLDAQDMGLSYEVIAIDQAEPV